MANMKVTELARGRIVYSERSFAELVVWRLQKPLPGSTHHFKYRLAFVVDGVCVLRYDNESGKGDHRHFGEKEQPYAFVSPEKLVTDFKRDIARWTHEDSNS
jgi:hypothetical protein